MRKFVGALIGAACAALLAAVPALACGGLVAPDGDVRLDKATTLVAWDAGVEHYVTSFAYSGSAAADVGWIVPLPAVPQSIKPAGRWTLQRLEREFDPPPVFFADRLQAAASAGKAVVVEQVQVEALDVTVLEGSGRAVIDWCVHNGFLLPPETRDHLLRYAQGSPVFMAAKYNTSLAQQRGLLTGDGVPLLITMRTPQLWVPLEVLANDNAPVNADLFLLTRSPVRPATAPFFTGLFGAQNVDGAAGFTLVRQEPLSASLYHDLAGDRNMGWVPSGSWVSYLRLNAPSDTVTYDLGLGRDSVIRLAAFGASPGRVAPASPEAAWPLAAAIVPSLLLLGAVAYAVRRRSRLTISTGSTEPPTPMPPSTTLKK